MYLLLTESFALERVTTVLVPLGVEMNKGRLPVNGIHECLSKHTYTDKISQMHSQMIVETDKHLHGIGL